MTEAILVALISGGLTLLGVIISNNKHQAIMDTKMDELTREVREHNNFAKRMPVVEEQIKVINHRIADLEDFHKGGGEIMEQLYKRLSNLLSIKSLVTLVLTAVFAYLTCSGGVTADQFLTVFTVVIAFYFGTQAEKNASKNT